MKSSRQQFQKTVDKMNREYKKDGSDFRAYLTGDPRNPIGLRSLSEADFPERTQDIKLYKLTKPL